MFNGFQTYIESVSRVSIEALLNGLWQGLLLTTLVWMTLKMIPRLKPALRQMIWFATLLAVVSLPFISGQISGQKALPGSFWSGLNKSASDPGTGFSTLTLTSPSTSIPEFVSENVKELPPEKINLTESSLVANESASIGEEISSDKEDKEYIEPELATITGVTDAPSASSIPATADSNMPESSGTPFRFTITKSVSMIIFALWALISGALLIRLLRSYLHLQRVITDGDEFPVRIMSQIADLVGRSDIRRNVRFIVSDQISSPLAIGLRAPVVAIPADLIDRLSPGELGQIVLHELAHLQRYDDWGVLFQKIFEALFFINPAVFWITGNLEAERELACDDAVVSITGAPKRYATCLAHLAEISLAPSRPVMAAGAFLTKKRLVHRVEQVLSDKFHFGVHASRIAVIGLFTLLVAALVQFTLTPAVVAVDRPALTVESSERSESKLVEQSGDEIHTPELTPSIFPAIYLAPPTVSSPIIYSPAQPISAVTHLALAALDESDSTVRLYRRVTQRLAETSFSGRELSERSERLKEIGSRLAQISLRADTHKNNSVSGAQALKRIKSRLRDMEREYENYSRTRENLLGEGNRLIAPRVSAHGEIRFPELVTSVEDIGNSPLVTVAPRVRSLARRSAEISSAPKLARLPSAPRVPRVSASNSVNSIVSVSGLKISGDFVIHNDGDEVSYSWTDRGRRYTMRAYGEIEFTENDDDVKSLSEDGLLVIREKYRGDDREYEVSEDGAGGLERTYYVDGRRQELDDEAHEWIGKMILRAVRNTGIGAESRALRILNKQGIDGVLDEIEEINSSYAMRLYYNALIEHADLKKEHRVKLLGHLSRGLDSDYEMAEILSDMDEKWLTDAETRVAYVNAVSAIDSDYEKRRALGPLVKREDLSQELRLSLLEIAREIDSDYERAELLGEIARSGLDEAELIDAFVFAIEDIDSDYEKRRVLSFITERKNLSNNTVLAVLKMSQSIDSDYERAELLTDMYRYTDGDDDLLAAYVAAIEDIDSDYEKRRVLDELTSRKNMDEKLTLYILELSRTIDSDYERAELLTEMSRFIEGNPKLIEAYIDALMEIDSDYEMRRVFEELELDSSTDVASLKRILAVVERMSSDYEKSKILKYLGEFCLDNDELYDPFLDAVDSISSEYERNQLLSMIYDHERRQRRNKK